VGCEPNPPSRKDTRRMLEHLGTIGGGRSCPGPRRERDGAGTGGEDEVPVASCLLWPQQHCQLRFWLRLRSHVVPTVYGVALPLPSSFIGF